MHWCQFNQFNLKAQPFFKVLAHYRTKVKEKRTDRKYY